MATGQIQFSPDKYEALGQAVDLGEEIVSEAYRLSEAFWANKGRYEVKTLGGLGPEEVTDRALAQIIKYLGPDRASHRPREFYRICIQDHRIQAAWKAADLEWQTLLTYVMTHELVHVVRFARHEQLFEARDKTRMAEEEKVHQLTCDLLSPLGLRGADKVFAFATPLHGRVVMEVTRRAVAPARRRPIKEEPLNAYL